MLTVYWRVYENITDYIFLYDGCSRNNILYVSRLKEDCMTQSSDLAKSFVDMYRHINNLDKFGARIQEIFDLNKPTYVEKNTHKKMLNDLTLYNAYNMIHDIIKKIENFRKGDEVPAVYIKIGSSGKPEVDSPKRTRTMNDIIKFYRSAVKDSELADMSVYLCKDSTKTLVRIVDIPLEQFYDLFDLITSIKSNFKYEDAIFTRLGDTNSYFKWYGV